MVAIRLATPIDIPLIASLINRDSLRLSSVCTQVLRGQLDVALAIEEDVPVGYALMQPRRIPPSRANGLLQRFAFMRQRRAMADPASLLQPMQIADVKDVFVRPKYRHCGMGKALITRAIEHAHACGIDDIRVHLKSDPLTSDRLI